MPDDRNTPVLLLVFNRPNLTIRTIEAMRQLAPTRVFVAADGPRPGHSDDISRTRAVREAVRRGIDWNCELELLERDQNLGCRVAVSSAIDWFFGEVAAGIILEDDCLVDPSFFRYATETLDRYWDDERVFAVTAQSAGTPAMFGNASYRFSHYNFVWGWASWRRAWQYYDVDMSLWPELRDTDWLRSIGRTRAFTDFWTARFDEAYRKDVDSWAYAWTFACWGQAGITAVPRQNLVSNIGFGVDATHTHNEHSPMARLRLGSLEFPLKHPQVVTSSRKLDTWADRHVFGIRHKSSPIGLAQRARRKLRNLVRGT